MVSQYVPWSRSLQPRAAGSWAVNHALRAVLLALLASAASSRLLHEVSTPEACHAPFTLPDPLIDLPAISTPDSSSAPEPSRLSVHLEDYSTTDRPQNAAASDTWHPHSHRHSSAARNGSSIAAVCAPPGLKGREAWVRGSTGNPLRNLRVLTRSQCRRAVTSSGAGGPFDAFIQRLARGDPVTLVFLGGSITEGTGAGDRIHSWPHQLCDWIQAAFPNDGHKCVNGAIGGTPSSYMELCLEAHVPAGLAPDLVLLEYTVNDGMLWRDNHREPWSMERLLRKLLQLPSAPAAMLVNFYPYACSSVGGCRGQGRAHRSRPPPGGYGTIDAQFAELAQYYNLPSLSLQAATYQAVLEEREGFRLPPPECMHERCADQDAFMQDRYFVINDRMHPNPRGHRMLAQLAVHLIQQAVVEQVLYPAPEPWPALPNGSLPEPYLYRNYEVAGGCWHGAALRQIVHRSQGWGLTDEAPRHPDSRWGMSSSEPGSELTFELDTTAFAHTGETATEKTNAITHATYLEKPQPAVTLSLLRSYEGFGAGRVECGGCSCTCVSVNCRPPAFDASWAGVAAHPISPAPGYVPEGRGLELDAVWPTRVTEADPFTLRVTQSPSCRIRITSIEVPGRTAFKLKVMSVTLASEATATSTEAVEMAANKNVLYWESRDRRVESESIRPG